MLGTYEAVISRRSVRKYRREPVKDEDLKMILEAARQAPSGKNAQPWHFVVVRDPERKREVARACAEQMWMADADVIVCGVGFARRSPKWHVVDTTIALQNMILVATSLGYGTCWIGAYYPDEVKKALALPDDATVVCLTPVGVPDESPRARGRRAPSEIFSLDVYGRPMPGV